VSIKLRLDLAPSKSLDTEALSSKAFDEFYPNSRALRPQYLRREIR